MPEDVGHVLMQFRGPAGLEPGRCLCRTEPRSRRLPHCCRTISRIASRKKYVEDSSFLLRLHYDVDGWTLFKESPLADMVWGATEGLLTSVQPFFYESLYLHNHLLQVMDETSLLGLACIFWHSSWERPCCWSGSFAKRARPLAAMLLACLVMMNLHGLMEISFSVQMFQCAAFSCCCCQQCVTRNLYRGEKGGPPVCGPGGVGPVAGDFCCPAGRKPAGPKRNIGSWMLPE